MLALLFTGSMPVMAATAPDTDYDVVPIVEVLVEGQQGVLELYDAGLDVLRVYSEDYESDVYNVIIMVHEQERDYFAANGIIYTVINEDATAQIDYYLGYAPEFPAISRANAPLPGFETGTGSNQYPRARTDLVINPYEVFDPAGVLMDDTYGFPVRLGYRTVSQYYAEMNYLAEAYPDLVKLHVMGYSHGSAGSWTGTIRANERWAPIPLVVMEICKDPGVNDGRPGTFHYAGNHAREWPSNEFAMDMVWNLLTGYGEDALITGLLDGTKVYVMPVSNPDGMHWDQTHSPGTFRRNRLPAPALANYGVDINRNYAYDWGSNQGSSATIGSETYRGPAPLSEPEARAVADVVLKNQIMTSISGHTWGDMILYPWSFSTSIGHQDMANLAREMFKISLYADKISNALYYSNGGSCDYIFGVTGGFSYTFEHMRHPSTGFVPPYEGVNEYKVLAPYTDYNGSRHKMPVLYATSTAVARAGAPASDVTGEAVFLKTNGVDDTFAFGYGDSGRFATVAKVQALGNISGKILMAHIGSSATVTRDVILAAQSAGAVGVILCNNSSSTATSNDVNTDIFRPSFGTTGTSLNITIPVAQTNKAHLKKYQEWVKDGGLNEVTITSYAEPGGNSIYSHFERLVGAFLLNIEAAATYSSFINGSILDSSAADADLVESAVLDMSLVVKSPRRHANDNPASANNPQPNPIGYLSETRTSRYDVTDGTYSWAVTPSVQPHADKFSELINDGYVITASAPGRYSKTKNVVVDNRGLVLDDVDFILPKAVDIDYDATTFVGNDAEVFFSTFLLDEQGVDSYKGFDESVGVLTVTVNGTPIEAEALGDGDFKVSFRVEDFSGDTELIIELDGIPLTYQVGLEINCEVFGHELSAPQPYEDNLWAVLYCERIGCDHFELIPNVVEELDLDAFVTKLSGNKNNLTITVTETYTDGSVVDIVVTISIDNNAIGIYKVGDYKVYVDTKGNIQIRELYFVE